MKEDEWVKVSYNNNNTHLTDIVTITLPSIPIGHGEYRTHAGNPVNCPTYSMIVMILPGATTIEEVFNCGGIPEDREGLRNLEYEMLKPHVELILLRREIHSIKEQLTKILEK